MNRERIKKEVAERFDQLVAAMNQKDVRAWSKFYSQDHFLSAIAGTDYYGERSDWTSAVSDFFAKRQSQSLNPSFVTVKPLTSDLALLTSEEKTKMHMTSGQELAFRHVFSMIWKRETEGWEILHSHESWEEDKISETAAERSTLTDSAGVTGMVTKVFVDAKGFVLFSCPNCNKVRKEQADSYKGAGGPVKIVCQCGQAYDVGIEFRRVIRKMARIDGMYFHASNSGVWGKMVVKNISLHGCGFETLKANPFQPEDEMRMEFHLDDAKQTLIKKRALVRSVDEKYVGCQFIEKGNEFDPELGFYLRKL